MRIGLFDSGLGGITVLKKLIKKYPHNDYIYYGDTLNIPYGNKSIQELKEYANKAVKFLLTQKVDIIIIACGTISSNCLSYLKHKYNIKIYDIISPTINYLNKSNYQNIGIIATSRTIESHIFKNRLNKNITEIAIPELVPLIENNTLTEIPSVLSKYLRPYQTIFDALVLGCTHYPIIENYIKQILPNTNIINMADYLNIPNTGNGQITIYFTKLNNNIINNIKRILNNDISVNLVNEH